MESNDLKPEPGKYYLYSVTFSLAKYKTLEWLDFAVHRFLALAPFTHSNNARWRFLSEDGPNVEFILQIMLGLPHSEHLVIYPFLESIVSLDMADFYKRCHFAFLGVDLPS